MISTSKFYTILNALKQKGVVKEHTINLGGRGGSATFLEITQEGCEAIGIPLKPHLTRGGNFITDVWVSKILEHMKEVGAGWKINVEKQIQGKFMDMVLEGINQEGVISIEIELSDANLKSNIEQDVEKVDFLVEACIDDSVFTKAQEIIAILPRDKQSKIGLCLLTKLLRCAKLSEVIDSKFLEERGL
jgi:sugar-specific transcriptional regulator TrmB